MATASAPPAPEDVARLKEWAKANSPSKLRSGELHTVSLDERDLNIGLRSFMPYRQQQNTRITFSERTALAQMSVRLPDNRLGSYLNLAAVVEEGDAPINIKSVDFGGISLPGWVLIPAQWAVEQYLESAYPELLQARDALQNLEFDNDSMALTYRWDWELALKMEERGREALITPVDRQRAVAYYRVLSRISHAQGTEAPLSVLLQALFDEAEKRSDNENAAAENRVLLLVLGTVLNRTGILRVIGGDSQQIERRHKYVKWTLHRRNDLALHFAVSAAITATGTSAIADVLGEFKELDDARDGSGFSFVDLLADRAGVEFADIATRRDTALALQQFMRDGAMSESDYMPEIRHLPENLMSLAFKQRYRDLDDARYGDVKQDIDQRIRRLPVMNLQLR